ncbi:flagellar filament capping protein FliD [Brevibacillus fulvus]|uniref:Flagellar hook-associated protein 2 n=1 Tax=Brevibacillus fulvus TaxID=1125967 RepID=A0A939BQD2_9BACL|nr:flagellar filament capping protein FliD [Brevibacillus fulvus]MBM7591495.1 flagellar hook-associated protein 2 [Brevibacillus fulvus]
MTIRITGLASGLDIDSLVSEQVKAKRVPLDSKKQKLQTLTWKREAYQEVNTKINSFLSEARKLTLQASFLTKKASLSASDSEKVLVTPATDASTGNFTLKVKQIAKNATVSSSQRLGLSDNMTRAVATSDVTLKVTGQVGAVDVAISNGDNISQIVSKINAQSTKTGVKASYDKLLDKFTLVSTSTGEAAKVGLDVTGDDDFLNKLGLASTGTTSLAPVTGQDAIIDFNGNGDTHVASNSFTVGNISFTLLQDPDANGTDSEYTISGSVNNDVDTVVETVKGVIDKYNELISSLNTIVDEKKNNDYPPLTDEQKEDMEQDAIDKWEEKAKQGLLHNDSVITTSLDQMRRYLSDSVSGLSSSQYDSLADIGITTKQSDGSNDLAYLENGKLYVDEDKLRQALLENPDQVSNLFTKSGTTDANGKLTNPYEAGVGTRLFSAVNEFTKAISEKIQIVPTRSTLQEQIETYTRDIEDLEDKLDEYEEQLYLKYSSMESSLNNLNSQSSYLSSFFSTGS